MIKGVEDDELANLTDEEKAALEDGDVQDAEDAKDLKAIADEKGPGDDEDDDDDDEDAKAAKAAEAEAAAKKEEDEAAAAKKAEEGAAKVEEARRAMLSAAERAKEDEAAAAAKKKDEEEAAAAAAAKEEEVDEPSRPRLPRYQVAQVEKYEDQVKALDDADAEAEKKFKAGNLELPDLLKEQRDNATKRSELREAKLKADMATEYNANADKTEWMADVSDFFARTKAAEGIDYNKPLLNSAFDTAIRALGKDEANRQRSSAWFLREAHKQVKAEIGIVDKPADKGGAGKEKVVDKGGKKPEGRKPALAIVKDVGGLPNAGDDDAAGGEPEFAALDKLSGIELEDALAAMPAAKQDRYLRAR